MDLELLHTWAGRALGTMPSDREDGRQLGVTEELQVRFRSDVSACGTFVDGVARPQLDGREMVSLRNSIG